MGAYGFQNIRKTLTYKKTVSSKRKKQIEKRYNTSMAYLRGNKQKI